MRLNADALDVLAAHGLTEAQWARENHYADGRWGGDACGCPDDRCIGFHHDEHDECGCLPALLDARGPQV
ncbi:hypothetical protein [Amycolatopsis sp. La24]|uniref:hypothetical protein n=1 Tax=Amycolatopsis sp. La24 TaxID=3028304 RepID=UPI0023B1242D|nr:hypothetical protein [Amycolatopsis sp. La24]